MPEVAVIGAGHSKFGERRDVNIPELCWESMKQALESAGIEPKDVDFFVVGNAGVWSSEMAIPSLMAEYADLAPKGSMRVEAACASGSAAIRVGYTAIKSGLADIVLVLGIEKMRESTNPTVIELIGRFGNYFWEFENFGLTFPAYYALHAICSIPKGDRRRNRYEESLHLMASKALRLLTDYRRFGMHYPCLRREG